jgi:hypothetical protein
MAYARRALDLDAERWDLVGLRERPAMPQRRLKGAYRGTAICCEAGDSGLASGLPIAWPRLRMY